jgi:hypothetical protein
MEMFEAPSEPMFSMKRMKIYSLKEYIKEFNEQPVIDRLADYIYKDMAVYFAINEEETEYCISVDELYRIGLRDLYPDDIIEDVKFALSRYFTDDFEIQYDKYGNDYTERFVTITFNREWNGA